MRAARPALTSATYAVALASFAAGSAGTVVVASCHVARGEERVFVSNEDGGSVAIVDAGRGEVVATVPVGKRPRGLRLSPDGRTLYVACGPDGDLAVIDAARGKVRARVKVGGSPWGAVASR
jgi:YVTN family beta-propeller protein